MTIGSADNRATYALLNVVPPKTSYRWKGIQDIHDTSKVRLPGYREGVDEVPHERMFMALRRICLLASAIHTLNLSYGAATTYLPALALPVLLPFWLCHGDGDARDASLNYTLLRYAARRGVAGILYRWRQRGGNGRVGGGARCRRTCAHLRHNGRRSISGRSLFCAGGRLDGLRLHGYHWGRGITPSALPTFLIHETRSAGGALHSLRRWRAGKSVAATRHWEKSPSSY